MAASNKGHLTEGDTPIPLKIRGAHGAPFLGFNTLYARGDFGGGVLMIYGSPTESFSDAFPWGGVELSTSGCVNFLGRADTFFLILEGGDTPPNINFWVL